jgi:hypothetical protein
MKYLLGSFERPTISQSCLIVPFPNLTSQGSSLMERYIIGLGKDGYDKGPGYKDAR